MEQFWNVWRTNDRWLYILVWVLIVIMLGLTIALLVYATKKPPAVCSPDQRALIAQNAMEALYKEQSMQSYERERAFYEGASRGRPAYDPYAAGAAF